AAMVLTDDNFSSIVAAVHEGREIFENIKKYLVYLLAGNLGLVIYLSSVVFFGTLMGIPSDIIPMTAIQILFINLICDGFIAVALSTGEPRDPYIMDRKPRRRDENIFSGQILSFIGFAGLWTGLMTLFSLYWAYNTGHTIEEAVAIAFLTLLFLRFFHAFNCRSIRTSAIVAGPFKNSWLSITLGLNALLAVAIVYLPVFQRMFRTYSIALSEWGMILALGITVVTAMEVYKLIRHHGSR
ncbi:MAG: cation transporting ATPase C-terminal domain-containing protein, partial [Thermoplasmata archaeon]